MSDLSIPDTADVEAASDSTAAAPAKAIARRHDLDALRAIAMLLGIVIHAVLSFLPFAAAFWGVQDTRTNPAFGIVLGAIHGFRMPLFFLISGFFTSMLWRKRGLKSLMIHRFKRIFLPLVLSLVTIIPLTFAVGAYIAANGGKSSSSVEHKSQETSTSVDPDEFVGACCAESAELVQALIAAGADINARNSDGGTGIHAAIFFGRAEVVEVLLESGVDLTVTDKDGRMAVENLYTPWELVKMVAGWFQINVTAEGVLDGRRKIARMLDKPFSADQMGLTDGDSNESSESEPKPLAGAAVMNFLRYNPYLGHLWFLWFLCILVIAFALFVWVLQLAGRSRLPTAITLSPFRYLWWIPITMILQSMMGREGEGFGPDTSVTFIPQWPVVAYYAIFFVFGALYFDADDAEGKFGSWWYVAFAIALIAFPIGMSVAGEKTGGGRVLFVMCQAIYVWAMSAGSIGFFRQFMSGESKAMRYISDSSYWLYLAHIPLVMYLQFVVREWNVSPVVKCGIVCVVSSVLLLLSYQWFVRYTPIGTLLNGPRKRPETTSDSAAASA